MMSFALSIANVIVYSPLREFEGNGVSNVHAPTAWAAAYVEEEGFTALVDIKNLVKVAMAEEESPTKPSMWFLTCELGEPLQKFLVN